jgi:hypothetical protein
MLVKVEYLGIANLLLDEPMYPSLFRALLSRGPWRPSLMPVSTTLGAGRGRRRRRRVLRAFLDVPAGHDAGGWLAQKLELAR